MDTDYTNSFIFGTILCEALQRVVKSDQIRECFNIIEINFTSIRFWAFRLYTFCYRPQFPKRPKHTARDTGKSYGRYTLYITML